MPNDRYKAVIYKPCILQYEVFIFYLSTYGNVDSYFISNIDTARMEDPNNANAGGVLLYSWYSHHSNI